MRINILE
ncbi:hypothetical protein D030_5277, partial [Vibrio parahaemolyticus AQ3810]